MTRLLSFDVGTKNLSFCDLTVDSSMGFEVHAWTVASTVPRGVNVNKTPLWDLAPPFYTYVRSNVTSWLWNADGSPKPMDRVLIENQPMGGRGAARNLKTKVLSHILQCAILESRPDLNVSFVHPGLKLKDMPKPLEGGKTTYRENKLYAINKTAELLVTDLCKNKDVCKELYLDKKLKKDDLADAFLQGLFVAHIVSRGDMVEAKNTMEDTTVVKPKKSSKTPKAGAKAETDAKVDTDAVKPKKTRKPKSADAAPTVVAVPVAPEPLKPETTKPDTKLETEKCETAKSDTSKCEVPKKAVKRTKKTSSEIIAEEVEHVPEAKRARQTK